MNKKEIYIRMKDGDKESELQLSDLGEEHYLSLMEGMFQFFDIDVSFKDMAATYMEIGHLYKDFYDNVTTTSFTETNEPPAEKEPEELFKMGIKEKHNTYHYRCRYRCPKCGAESNHYIKPDRKVIYCYDCNQKMPVHPATEEGFPEHDENYNYFIAGDFTQQ